jgi:hypothetical protein
MPGRRGSGHSRRGGRHEVVEVLPLGKGPVHGQQRRPRAISVQVPREAEDAARGADVKVVHAVADS